MLCPCCGAEEDELEYIGNYTYYCTLCGCTFRVDPTGQVLSREDHDEDYDEGDE